MDRPSPLRGTGVQRHSRIFVPQRSAPPILRARLPVLFGRWELQELCAQPVQLCAVAGLARSQDQFRPGLHGPEAVPHQRRAWVRATDDAGPPALESDERERPPMPQPAPAMPRLLCPPQWR